jgi:peptide-methionine (S)-S-oxide reductase
MGNVLCGWSSRSDEDGQSAGDKYVINPGSEGEAPSQSKSGSSSSATAEYSEDKEVWRVSLGAGCYWGTENYVKRKFPKRPENPPGELIEGQVGFMGPKNALANPDYEQVCSGTTKHVEVYDVKFKGGAVYFEELLHYYFMFHDPTTSNRQGNDRGTQYASVVYCYNQAQFDIATRVKAELQDHLNKRRLGRAYTASRICTDVRMVEASFYAAHDDHQEYLAKNPGGYCNHSIRFDKWPSADEGAD